MMGRANLPSNRDLSSIHLILMKKPPGLLVAKKQQNLMKIGPGDAVLLVVEEQYEENYTQFPL